MPEARNGAATTDKAGAQDFVDQFENQRDSKPWLDAIKEAEQVFHDYQESCDNIDKEYANLKEFRGETSDREYKLFTANLETLQPAIYARPPQPAVVPAFKDRKPIPRVASEVLERTLVTSVRKERLHRKMKLVRNSVARHGRGVLWMRYDIEARKTGKRERTPYDYLNRRDFLHEPARNWEEVGWVARRSFLTMGKGRKRFGDKFLEAEFVEEQTDTHEDYRVEKKALVWEIWSKTLGLVVWVTPGVDEVLDIGEPHLDLEEFFPCPEPAYGILQPETLIPIPDYLIYKDQLEEINLHTRRIYALTEALRVKGFYPAGAEDVGETIEKILLDMDDRAVLVPVPNLAALAGATGGKLVEFWPIEEVVRTVQALIEIRRQTMEDVYQITGISDIMRGETEASETLGAQQLKAQYGSVRVRDKQEEMVRIARDALEISGEIIAENFAPESIREMSQTDIPDQAVIDQQIGEISAQAQRLPQEQQGQIQAAVTKLQEVVTFEKVFELFRNERLRPFILDVETDSTIQPDEDAEKQRRTEFVTAVGNFFNQAGPLVQAEPRMGPLIGEMLQFVTAPYRAGRQLEQTIDDLVEGLGQPQQQQQEGPDPAQQMELERIKAEAEASKMAAEAKLAQIQAKAEADMRKADAEMSKLRLEANLDREKHQREMAKLAADIQKIEATVSAKFAPRAA